MKIIKLAERDSEVPPGFLMIEVSVDENGVQKQKIIRGGKSKCSKSDENLLRDLLSIEMGEWGDGGQQQGATQLTNEGEEQASGERAEKYEKERVNPSTPVIPIIPTKKPGFQMPGTKPRTMQTYKEV